MTIKNLVKECKSDIKHAKLREVSIQESQVTLKSYLRNVSQRLNTKNMTDISASTVNETKVSPKEDL